MSCSVATALGPPSPSRAPAPSPAKSKTPKKRPQAIRLPSVPDFKDAAQTPRTRFGAHGMLGTPADFKLMKKLGSGASSRVYLAKDPKSGQLVAIKELSAHGASERKQLETVTLPLPALQTNTSLPPVLRRARNALTTREQAQPRDRPGMLHV